MKTLLTLVCLTVGLFLSGCASGIINSASTKLQFQDAQGKSFALTFPKELDATGLHVTVDPATGAVKLDADHVKSSNSALVESAAAAQAQSISTLSATVAQIVPILAKAAAVAVNPAAAPVLAAVDTPAATAPAEPVQEPAK